MTMRVINLGLPKSGTSTLARALRRAGLSCADHLITQTDENGSKTDHYVADLIYQGWYDAGDPTACLAQYDSISEMSVLRHGKSLWPQMDFAIIDALRTLHPDLRFVATKRDAFDMSQSMLAWSNLGDRLEKTNIPGLPPGYGETSKARMQWIEGHYAHLRSIFAGDDRFLELAIAADNAAEQLSGFLNLPLPWWGKRNANPMTNTAEAT